MVESSGSMRSVEGEKVIWHQALADQVALGGAGHKETCLVLAVCFSNASLRERAAHG